MKAKGHPPARVRGLSLCARARAVRFCAFSAHRGYGRGGRRRHIATIVVVSVKEKVPSVNFEKCFVWYHLRCASVVLCARARRRRPRHRVCQNARLPSHEPPSHTSQHTHSHASALNQENNPRRFLDVFDGAHPSHSLPFVRCSQSLPTPDARFLLRGTHTLLPLCPPSAVAPPL